MKTSNRLAASDAIHRDTMSGDTLKREKSRERDFMFQMASKESKFFNDLEPEEEQVIPHSPVVPGCDTNSSSQRKLEFVQNESLTWNSEQSEVTWKSEKSFASMDSSKKSESRSQQSPKATGIAYFDKIAQKNAPVEKSADNWLSRFNLTVGIVIFVNSIVIAIETDQQPGKDAEEAVYGALEHFFVTFFVLELLIRFKLEGISYFRSAWNWLDFSCALTSAADVWVLPLLGFNAEDTTGLRTLSLLRVLRLVRVVRLLRLFKMFSGIYVIVTAFAASMRSIFWVVILIFLGMFICSILTTQLIGQNSHFEDVKIEDDDVSMRFGTVPRSMFTLFELLLLEGWNSVGRPIIQKSPGMVLFFLFFIMVFTFGLLNMIVGMVVEQTIEHSKMNDVAIQKQNEAELKSMIMSLKDLFEAVDTDGNDELSYEEFETACKSNPEVVAVLERTEIPADQWKDLFCVLDVDGSGSLTAKEFLSGLLRMRGAARNRDLVATHITVTQLHRQQKKLLAGLRDAKKIGKGALESLENIEAVVLGQSQGRQTTPRELKATKALDNDLAAKIRVQAPAPAMGQSQRYKTTPREPEVTFHAPWVHKIVDEAPSLAMGQSQRCQTTPRELEATSPAPSATPAAHCSLCCSAAPPAPSAFTACIFPAPPAPPALSL